MLGLLARDSIVPADTEALAAPVSDLLVWPASADAFDDRWGVCWLELIRDVFGLGVVGTTAGADGVDAVPPLRDVVEPVLDVVEPAWAAPVLTTTPGAGATVAPPEGFTMVLPAPAVNELVDPADVRVGVGAKEPVGEPDEVDVDFDG